MRIGYEISKFLKDIKTQDGNERTARAMMVANALAYSFPIDTSKSGIDNAEDNMTAARKVVGQVNENISLDSRLCLELFKQAVLIRYELITQPTDSAIIEMAMRSHVAASHQTGAETVSSLSLLSNVEFARAQNGISVVLGTLATEEE